MRISCASLSIAAIAMAGVLTTSGNPNHNATTHLFTSPLLFDQSTIIGRSLPFRDGLGGDIGPALIGDPALDLNLSGGGFDVRAGAHAPGAPPKVIYIHGVTSQVPVIIQGTGRS